MSRRRLDTIRLIALLLLAFSLRVYHVDWADGQLPHPDERSTVAFYAPTIHWPTSWQQALNPHASPLNPLWDVGANHRRSYTYGHFPLYLLVGTANLLHKAAPAAHSIGAPETVYRFMLSANGVPGFALVGRVLMAISDTFTVLLLFLIAKRLYGRKTAFLAAFLSTFTVTQIQLAHFFAVDPISTTFTLLSIYGAMLMVEKKNVAAALLTATGMALAIASKFSALPILAAPAVVAYVLWRRDTSIERIAGLLATAYAGAFVIFAITSPYVLLDWPNFKQAVLVEQGAMVRGAADFPFTRQYRGTKPYIYFIVQSVRWGMGWALGILSWLGLAWALVKAALNRAKVGEWLILAWIVPYFGVTGLFLAKFMRYMLPITPFLIIFGAGLLQAVWQDGRRRSRAGWYAPRRWAWTQWLAVLLATITVGWTFIWGAAFMHGVYDYPHPWITASRWIYANVPDGSVIAVEHWDDTLPLSLPEPNANLAAHRYRQVVMPMYDEDNAKKFQIIKDNLRQADYYALATARLYRAIPHLPQRYPMTIKFYDLLFQEKLGFKRVADFTTYPRLGPLVFPDDNADESFWVYDHPRVIIFKKVRNLSDAEWNALLGHSWQGAKAWDVGPAPFIQKIWPSGNKQAPSPAEAQKPNKDLLLHRSPATLPVVHFWRWNSLANRSTPLAVFFWWLVLWLIGLAAWPITYLLLPNLRDRGYPFARAVGLILLAFTSWWIGSLQLWRNDLPLYLLLFVALLAFSGWLWYRHAAEFKAYWRAHYRLFLVYELIFAAAYLLFVWIRLLDPDLWQPWNGGEKFMEIAFFTATVRTPYFPPYDPYFAWGTLNYYYWGYQILNVLVKLTGIMPTVAFNLAVPTLFAMAFTGATSVVGNLLPGSWKRSGARFMAGGVLGGVFMLLFGNIQGGVQLLNNLAKLSHAHFRSHLPWLATAVHALDGFWQVLAHGAHLAPYNYWDPSRVIPYTINEFPYWSYLFADLHPHMIGIPFTILFIALAVNVLLGWKQRWFTDGILLGTMRFLLLPLLLGALAVINTWDVPTYFVLMMAALFIRQWRRKGNVLPFLLLVQAVVIGGGAYLFFLPFFQHYAPIASSGFGILPVHTAVGKWLAIWALWFFLALTTVWLGLTGGRSGPALIKWLRGFFRHWDRLPQWLQWQRRLVRPAESFSLLKLVFGAIWLLALLLALLKFYVPALLVPPLFIAIVLLFSRRADGERLTLLLLIALGLGVLLSVEFVYLRDQLQGGDFRRMNTLFKFYTQAWVLLSLAGAAALPRLWRMLRRCWPWGAELAWKAAFGVLVGLSLVFPLIGTPARVKDRFPQPLSQRPTIGTLDGMAYMKVGTYTWPDASHRIELKYDYEAIRWLQGHVPGTPMIAEARLDYYRAGGTRVASFTGLPTFMGLHEYGEQRYNNQVDPRKQLAEVFWTTSDPGQAWQIIQKLDIRYVYVGQLEHIHYPAAGLAKFDTLVRKGKLEVVYRNPKVVIYKRVMAR